MNEERVGSNSGVNLLHRNKSRDEEGKKGEGGGKPKVNNGSRRFHNKRRFP